MNETPKTPNHPDNGRGYEVRDASVGAVTKFGIGLAVIFVVVLLLMVWLQDYLRVEYKKAETPPSPLAIERQLPPGPHLQVVPAKDLKQMRAAEDSILHGYGWIVREAGIVRIPIDRAMELVVEKGLPFRVEGAPLEVKSGAQIAKVGQGGVQP